MVDDPTIDNDERLFRRIHPTQIVKDDSGAYRVSSAAFGDPQLSIDIRSTLFAAGLDEKNCVRAYPGYGLVSISADLARQQGQIVYRDPTEDNSAHGIVEGRKTNAVKKAFLAGHDWVIDIRPRDKD